MAKGAEVPRAIMRPLKVLFEHPVGFILRLNMVVVYNIMYLILVIVTLAFQERYR